MNKASTILMVILVFALISDKAIAIEYNTDISPELTVDIGECFYMDIWLENVPTPLVTAGLFIVHDSTLASIVDVIARDGSLDGPWDPGFTFKVPDADGPGTYMLACGQFATVSPDDVRIARAEICAIAEGINTITISTIPGFQTVVSGVAGYEVYDPQIIPHTVTVNQIIPPCRCEIMGQAIVESDGFNPVTAQYDVSSNLQHCDNPPNYEWYDDCALGDVDQSGLFTLPVTTDNENCSICVLDNANTDLVTGEPTECCKEIFIAGST